MPKPDETDRPAEPAPSTVYRSAATAVGLAWSMRLIGLVSVLVLARLLTPRDFGIVGLAMATVALVDIFSALGLRQALLRIEKPDRDHLDTAWTIQLLLLVFLAAVLAALAPLAARFYGEPALGPVVALLAVRFLFYGLANIGIVDFDRNLDFGRDLRMRMSVRLLSLAGTVVAALALQSYWALVIGLILQSALHAAASYVVHPFRPRFSLARRAELLGVSLWIFLAYAAQVVHHQLERLVIGRFAAMPVVGLYSVSKDLASIFTQEIATALNRVTFVTTARHGLRESPERIAVMIGAYAMIAAPLGLGLAAVAEDAVTLLLGAQWREAAPLLQLIAPASALYAVYKLVVSSLQASGHAPLAALISCAGTALAALLLIGTALTGGGPLAIATAALAASGTLLIVGILVIARIAGVPTIRLFGAAARPFAAAGAMLLLLRATDWSTPYAALDLAISVGVGALVYAAGQLLLWAASWCPAGAEAEAIGLLRRFGKRRGPHSLATR